MDYFIYDKPNSIIKFKNKINYEYEDYRNIRVLVKGKTALALKDKFPNATLYDDSDFLLMI